MSNSRRPVDWVDPLIDTAKPMVRWVFSASACRPFGMVNLSLDTDTTGARSSIQSSFTSTGGSTRVANSP